MTGDGVRVLPRLLVTFSAIDVPDEVQREVMALLAPYDSDIWERAQPRQVWPDSGSGDGSGVM